MFNKTKSCKNFLRLNLTFRYLSIAENMSTFKQKSKLFILLLQNIQ